MESIREREKLAYISDGVKAETAPQVVSKLDELLDFETVMDAGCGTGLYIKEFENIGKEVFGFDANIDANPPTIRDLRMPLNLGKYDLVFCIEVAEHIDPEYADVFVRNLVRATDKWLVMTACPPRPKSEYTKVAHVNEQKKEYWVKKVESCGLEYRGDLVDELQEYYRGIEGMRRWFNNDLMVYVRVPSLKE